MEFNIQRNVLLAGIQKTLGIVEKKTTMPILNNVLIKAEDGKITITATDREIALVAKYEAEVLLSGEITVSAKKIYEMIREIPGSHVHVKKNDNNLLTISCQKLVYRVNGLSAEEFPTVVDDGEVPLFMIDGGILSGLISKSLFAVSLDESRRNLTGTLFEVDKDGGTNILRMVATDGHRMAISEAVVEGDFLALDKGVIIPRKGLSEIRKLVEESAGGVFWGIYNNTCVVKVPDVVLKISLIDAEFPDYRRVMPKEAGIIVKFDKDTIMHALKRINVVSSEAYGGVVFNLKENMLVMKTSDYNVGEAVDEIDVLYSGTEMEVGYNIGYLMSAIDVIGEKDVVFEIGEGIKPSVIKGEGNNRYLCVVMPLKI